MCANWKDGFDHNLIAAKIKKITTVEGDKVSFGGFQYQELQSLLESMLIYKEDLPSEIRREIVFNGLQAAAKSGDIDSKSVLTNININENEYLSRKNTHYVLLTQLSLKNNVKLPKYVLDGHTIIFSRNPPERYRESRATHIETSQSFIDHNAPSDATYARVFVVARSAHEAAKKALEKIDFLRAIMNLHLTPASRMTFGNSKGSINEVFLGPVHSLHKTSGKSASKLFWYQPDYEVKKSIDAKTKLDRLVKGIAYYRKRLKEHQYRREVEEALLRYVRSFDYPDYNTSFIHAWGLLEYLTSTSSMGYKVTIRRAASLFTEYEYHKQVLTHLMTYRNSLVHAGNSISNIEPYLYQIVRYVRQLIIFHTNNHFNLDSLEHAGQFFDLAAIDSKLIAKRTKLQKHVLRFKGD